MRIQQQRSAVGDAAVQAQNAISQLGQLFLQAPQMANARANAALAQEKTTELQGRNQAMSQIGQVVQNMLAAQSPEDRQKTLAVAAQTMMQANRANAGNIGQISQLQNALNMNSTPDDMRRGLVAAGHMPNENFAATTAEGNRIAERNNQLATRKALSEIFAKPTNTPAGSMTTFAPADPRSAAGTVIGQPTLQTAKGAAFQQMTPQQQNAAMTGGAPSALGKLISERDALAPDDPNRAAYDAAIAKAGGAGGTPGGSVTVSNFGTTGNAPAGMISPTLAKPTVNLLQKNIVQAESMIASLDKAAKDFQTAVAQGGDPLTMYGDLKAAGMAKLGKVLPIDAMSQGEVANRLFNQTIGQLGQQYRLMVTGQAAADKELERIAKLIPGEQDNPQIFLPKVKAMQEIMGAVANRQRDMLRNGIDPTTPEGQAYYETHPLNIPDTMGAAVSNPQDLSSEVERVYRAADNGVPLEQLQAAFQKKYGVALPQRGGAGVGGQ